MIARRYFEKDFSQLRLWLELRKQKVFHPRILPDFGYIVDDIAAIFIYQTDSDICYLENLVSNPKAAKKERDDAIQALVDTSLVAAMGLGFKFVMAVTDNPSVIKRALQNGAKVESKKVLLTKQLV